MSKTFRGFFCINNLEFTQADQNFFGKHVWPAWAGQASDLTGKLRSSIADLALMRAVRIGYEVAVGDSHQESFTISAGDQLLATIVLGAASTHRIDDHPLVPIAAGVRPALQEFSRRYMGGHYGQGADQVDAATIVYKLHTHLMDIQGQALGHAELAEDGLRIWYSPSSEDQSLTVFLSVLFPTMPITQPIEEEPQFAPVLQSLVAPGAQTPQQPRAVPDDYELTHWNGYRKIFAMDPNSCQLVVDRPDGAVIGTAMLMNGMVLLGMLAADLRTKLRSVQGKVYAVLDDETVVPVVKYMGAGEELWIIAGALTTSAQVLGQPS